MEVTEERARWKRLRDAQDEYVKAALVIYPGALGFDFRITGNDGVESITAICLPDHTKPKQSPHP